MRSSRAWLLVILVGATVPAAACGGSKSCAQGTEQCPCYGNGTCNPGLTCASNTCVSLGGAGGASGGGGAIGGSNGGGSGGTSSAGAGGATGGSGGTSTGGSGGSCVANTSTDPMNCGACGHVCKNADPVFGGSCPTAGCCVNGACGPAPGSCITQQNGFASCAEYCASIGETFVQRGCYPGNVTFEYWSTADRCQSFYPSVDGFNIGTCDVTISWQPGVQFLRCCCTDTR